MTGQGKKPGTRLGVPEQTIRYYLPTYWANRTRKSEAVKAGTADADRVLKTVKTYFIKVQLVCFYKKQVFKRLNIA